MPRIKNKYLFTLFIIIVILVIIGSREFLQLEIEKYANWAFPKDNNKNGETIKLILSILGGILILFGLYISYIRANATQKSVESQNAQIELSRKAQTDERFKNAVEHLGSDKEPVILGGIAELNQITIDNPEKYKEVVFNIFCSYLRQESNIKKNAENINRTIVQAIINNLFKSGPYDNLKADLSFCNLNSIDFDGITFKNCDLRFSHIPWKMNDVIFINSELSKINVWVGRFKNVVFNNCNLSQAFFLSTEFVNTEIVNKNDSIKMNCLDCRFENSILDADFYDSSFLANEFNNSFFKGKSLSSSDFSGSSFYNVDFSKLDIYACNFSACGFNKVKMQTKDPIIECKFKSISNDYKYFSQFLEKKIMESINKESNYSGLNLDTNNLFKCDTSNLSIDDKDSILLKYKSLKEENSPKKTKKSKE